MDKPGHRISELIEALMIFEKYNENAAFQCEHNELYLYGVEPSKVSACDKKTLIEMGFFVDEDIFKSNHWGSC